MENEFGSQTISTATGWRHFPIIENVVELKRKLAICNAKWASFFFLVAVGVCCYFIISFQAKRLSDFLALFLLYAATLLLAMPPERTASDNDITWRDKQTRQVRVALGFVVVGTAMQFISFNLGDLETKAEEQKPGVTQKTQEMDKAAALTEERFKTIEAAQATLRNDLLETQSQIRKMQGGAEIPSPIVPIQK